MNTIKGIHHDVILRTVADQNRLRLRFVTGQDGLITVSHRGNGRAFWTGNLADAWAIAHGRDVVRGRPSGINLP